MFPLYFPQTLVEPIGANRPSTHATTLPYLAMSRSIVKEESFYEEQSVRHLFLMLRRGRPAATCRDFAETLARPPLPPLPPDSSDVGSLLAVRTSKAAPPPS